MFKLARCVVASSAVKVAAAARPSVPLNSSASLATLSPARAYSIGGSDQQQQQQKSKHLLNGDRLNTLTRFQISNYSTSQTNDQVLKRIDQLVKKDTVVVFMKGDAVQPKCGFSKAVVDILNIHGVTFQTYNVLEDEEIRSGIKEYSSWPTIPQVFFQGEFIGGCDIMLEMHRSGELVEELKKIGITSKLDDE